MKFKCIFKIWEKDQKVPLIPPPASLWHFLFPAGLPVGGHVLLASVLLTSWTNKDLHWSDLLNLNPIHPFRYSVYVLKEGGGGGVQDGQAAFSCHDKKRLWLWCDDIYYGAKRRDWNNICFSCGIGSICTGSDLKADSQELDLIWNFYYLISFCWGCSCCAHLGGWMILLLCPEEAPVHKLDERRVCCL